MRRVVQTRYLSPDDDCPILRCTSDGRPHEPKIGGPCNVSHPVNMLRKRGKQSILQLLLMYFHTFTVLSHPPDTSFWTGPASAPMRDPGALAGAHDTEVTPTGWACSILVFSHDPSAMCVRTEIVPSDDPHAKHSPNSWGAQQMLFTDDSCSWNTCSHTNTLHQSHW